MGSLSFKFWYIPLSLEKGDVHVLGDALSRVPNGKECEISTIQILKGPHPLQDEIENKLRTDRHFAPIQSKISEEVQDDDEEPVQSKTGP